MVQPNRNFDAAHFLPGSRDFHFAPFVGIGLHTQSDPMGSSTKTGAENEIFICLGYFSSSCMLGRTSLAKAQSSFVARFVAFISRKPALPEPLQSTLPVTEPSSPLNQKPEPSDPEPAAPPDALTRTRVNIVASPAPAFFVPGSVSAPAPATNDSPFLSDKLGAALPVEKENKLKQDILERRLAIVVGFYVLPEMDDYETAGLVRISVSPSERGPELIVDHWKDGRVARLYHVPLRILVEAPRSTLFNLYLTAGPGTGGIHGGIGATWSLRIMYIESIDGMTISIQKNGAEVFRNSLVSLRAQSRDARAYMADIYQSRYADPQISVSRFLEGTYDVPTPIDPCARFLTGEEQ